MWWFRSEFELYILWMYICINCGCIYAVDRFEFFNYFFTEKCTVGAVLD